MARPLRLEPATIAMFGGALLLLDSLDVAVLGFLTQLVLAGAAGLATAYGLATLLRVPEIDYARRMAVNFRELEEGGA